MTKPRARHPRPAVPDATLRRVLALWPALTPAQRQSIVPLLTYFARSNRAAARAEAKATRG